MIENRVIPMIRVWDGATIKVKVLCVYVYVREKETERKGEWEGGERDIRREIKLSKGEIGVTSKERERNEIERGREATWDGEKIFKKKTKCSYIR